MCVKQRERYSKMYFLWNEKHEQAKQQEISNRKREKEREIVLALMSDISLKRSKKPQFSKVLNLYLGE